MKKKLLFVIDSLGMGGAEKSMISLLPLIDYSRFDVDLMVFKRRGVLKKYVPEQVKIINFQRVLCPLTLVGRTKRLFFKAILSPQYRWIKNKHGAEIYWRTMHRFVKPYPVEYDVAIAYQQGTPSFFVASKIHARKKLAWVNVNTYAAGYDMDYCRQFYEKMDHVVAVSERLKDIMSEKSPWIKDKLTCVYDIVNQDVIRKMANEPVSDLPALVDNEVLLVTTGRLAPQKNHILAVETARVLKDKGIAFKWLFVGEGECRSSIESKIAELGLQQDVVLLGLKENPYPYMAKADVYVQTSSFEGFGLTIAEAKILHRPIVSTNFDVVHDQITDRINGLIAQMNAHDLADKIQEILQNDQLRDSIVSHLDHENNSTATTEIKKINSLIDC